MYLCWHRWCSVADHPIPCKCLDLVTRWLADGFIRCASHHCYYKYGMSNCRLYNRWVASDGWDHGCNKSITTAGSVALASLVTVAGLETVARLGIVVGSVTMAIWEREQVKQVTGCQLF